MKKNKIFGLEDWERDKNYPDKERFVELSVYVTSIDYKDLLHLTPTERAKTRNADRKVKVDRLLKTGFFVEYSIIGNRRNSNGISGRMPFSLIRTLEKMDIVWNIFVKKVDHAQKRKETIKPVFYCVRMTVAIEIEGRTKGIQTIEERFVLVKARSFDDALKKIEKTKRDYSEPYLNPYGQLVRWRIESLDDCYATDINDINDFAKPQGAEVFSVLKKRKLTPDRVWDGKLDG